MGTAFAVEIDDEAAHGLIERVFDWWNEVEARFSTFRPDSEISRIGLGELHPDDAHPDVRHVLSVCDELAVLTDGRFTVRPGRPGGPGLDPAGFVKGWSVDEAALMLRGEGHDDFMLYAGGDVLCSGHPADADAWHVGIRDPGDVARVLAAVELERGAVATSGTYERGAHVWGPDAGRSLASVTVIGPALGMADAIATAILAGGPDDLTWLRRFEGYGAVLVDPEGAMSVVGRLPLGVAVT